jgi:predicted CopG family antitoxin
MTEKTAIWLGEDTLDKLQALKGNKTYNQILAELIQKYREKV